MRNVGDVFEVTEERHEEILTKGGLWVEPVEELETEPEPVEEPTKETTKPKATKKGKA